MADELTRDAHQVECSLNCTTTLPTVTALNSPTAHVCSRMYDIILPFESMHYPSRIAPPFALACLLASLPAQAAEPAPVSTMLVLDASGSMRGRVGGRQKMKIAREALNEMVAKWDPKSQLGLMAYGHTRKGDCTDIEILISPAKKDEGGFRRAAKKLRPRGMTPLTEAVARAAAALRSSERKATVILISDGKETCEADPCEVGRRLQREGVDFTAHVIGFDVPKEDTAGMRCLARVTGGLFIEARDAEQLSAALKDARQASVAPKSLKMGAATVTAPAQIVSGSRFLAQWTGPKNPSDYLAIRSVDRARRHGGTPVGPQRVGPEVQLRAPLKPGPYVLTYEVGRHHAPLAETNIEVIPATGTLQVPLQVTAGAQLPVTWTGPGNSADRIFIYDAQGKKCGSTTARAKDNRQTSVRAPTAAGRYEARLITAPSKVLAVAPFEVVAAQASLEILSTEIRAGKSVRVAWTGPRNRGDRLVVGLQGSKKYLSQRSATKNTKSPTKLRVPRGPGEYEARLQASNGTVLATAPFTAQ